MRHQNGDGRAGLTLIEVLVVVSIIGILIGLIIPAVSASREASRRASCISNLKQIGLALNAHAAAHGRFPHAADPDRRALMNRPISPHLALLPYLEQAALYQSFNLDRRANEQTMAVNSTWTNVRVAGFLCPSNTGLLEPGCDYRGCVGPNPFEFEEGMGPGGGGAFPLFKALAPSDFTDGLSNTAGFSERTRGSGRSRPRSDPLRFDRRRDLWASGLDALVSGPSSDVMAEACAQGGDNPARFWDRMGEGWSYGAYSDTLYNHVATPNGRAPDCSPQLRVLDPLQINGGAISARSGHPGRVHVLLLDGSVRAVSDSVAVAVWRAFASRKGGESINSPGLD